MQNCCPQGMALEPFPTTVSRYRGPVMLKRRAMVGDGTSQGISVSIASQVKDAVGFSKRYVK